MPGRTISHQATRVRHSKDLLLKYKFKSPLSLMCISDWWFITIQDIIRLFILLYEPNSISSLLVYKWVTNRCNYFL